MSNSLSQLFDRVEASGSLVQAALIMKPIAIALKKNPVPFGQTSGLAPVLLMLEPIFPQVKGYSMNSLSSEKIADIGLPTNVGPKGQAQAQAFAQQTAMASVMGISTDTPIALKPTEIQAPRISAVDSVDLINDFSQMLDILADRCNVRRLKRFGNFFCIIHII